MIGENRWRMWSLWVYSHDFKMIQKMCQSVVCFFKLNPNFPNWSASSCIYICIPGPRSIFLLIDFFFQLLFPLHFTNRIGKVDIVAKVEQSGGYMGKSGAIRFGIATALTSFVDEETVERMRIGKFEFLYFIIVDCCCCSLIVGFISSVVSLTAQIQSQINCDLIYDSICVTDKWRTTTTKPTHSNQ